MPDEPSGTANAEAEIAPETTEVSEQPKPEIGKTSLADALKAAAIADGTLPQVVDPQPAATTTESEVEPEPEAEPEAATETEPPKGLSIGDQITWYKDHEQKPPWYLTRIAEQTVTTAKRTERAERAEARVQELESQLAKASGPQPTAQQPFVDIFDRNELAKLEETFEKSLEMATKYPNGVQGLVVGKNKDGSDMVWDLDAEQIADIRYKADKALRKDIPARAKFLDQLDQFKRDRAKADVSAFDKYPEFKDPENPMTQEAIALLKQNPNLEIVLGPEVLTWIGRALKGKAMENGNTAPRSDAASRILQSANTKVAPSTTRTRQMPVATNRGANDVESAKKRFMENPGDEDAAAAYTAAKLLAGKRGTVNRLETVS